MLQWRHNEWDGVSNHQPHDCLHNRLFGCRSKKTSKLRVTGLCAGKSPVNSLHKGPVTRKMFPFDDVIMTNKAIGCRSAYLQRTSLVYWVWHIMDIAQYVYTIMHSQSSQHSVCWWPGNYFAQWHLQHSRWHKPRGEYTETEMSSFLWNFHHWLHWKLSKWQLPVQPVIRVSANNGIFVSVYHNIEVHTFKRERCA